MGQDFEKLVFSFFHYSLILFIWNFFFLKNRKLNIKEAIDFIVEAWDAVKQSTIVNCWKKTGILPIANEENEETTIIEQISTDEIIESLNRSNLSVDSEILEYINDNELSLTEKPLDDDEIVQMVLDENNEPENEDIDEPKVIVTNKDALEAVNTLIEYFECQNDLEFNENDYKNLKEYKKVSKERFFFQQDKQV